MPHPYSSSKQESHIPGITHDPVLRPIGALLVAFGAVWALWWGMALDAGTFGEPRAAGALVILGLLLAAVGKPGEQNWTD